ncbi:MAG: hypothetical protein II829_03715 [Bacteroidales bacterium]|jgi:uncharacterized lipoprotein NlpE involved in copper resistance|nr:MAG: hypothetical protein F082_1129 [bacterium F082]KWW28624.1 MAG: hypothetical protein AUK64_1600 [bacterium P201]MBQ4398678.1 hypothetical protein [Bacteroidales bacterium]
MKRIPNIIIHAAVTALAVLLLAGCQNRSNKGHAKAPHEEKEIHIPAPIDTSAMDEEFYRRMWEFEALHPSSPSDK